MFKRLRERISEEASKSVAQLGSNSPKPLNELENKTSSTPSTGDLITLNESSSVVLPYSSSQQFSIGEDDDGSMSEQSTPQKTQPEPSNGGTPYSTPSAGGQDFSFSQEYRPKRLSYVPQSDIESEREDPPTLNLEGISKDQLLSVIDILKARTYKYKNKYSEVVKNFKELRDEKTKIEKTLIETQDKGSRRIAELREQCQLEQKAKAHLEENLRLNIEEKENRITVLETQIAYLKDSSKKESNDDQQSSELPNDLLTGDNITSESDQSSLLEKLERLEHQLSQAKKTITAQTDQIALLKKQNENNSQELEEKVKKVNELEDSLTNLNKEHAIILKTMQIRLEELEKQQEESAMAMAETKKNMHEELELKEKQLVKAKAETAQHLIAVEAEKQKVIEVHRQYEGKIGELQKQLETTEKTLEDEKKNLMNELARGKTAAITLMKKDCAQKIAASEKEWKTKYQDLQSQISQASKEEKRIEEIQDKLHQAESQVNELNSLVIQLEQENESLKNSSEKIKSAFENRSVEYETLQVSYNDLKYLRETETSSHEEKLNQLKFQIKELDQLKIQIKELDQLKIQAKELNNNLSILTETAKQYKETISILNEQLNQKQVVIDTMIVQEKESLEKIKSLENKVSSLNICLQDLNNELEQIKANEKLKIKEIDDMKVIIKTFQTKGNICDESEEKNTNLSSENEIHLVKLNVLNDKMSQMEMELTESQKCRAFFESIIQAANIEIKNLKDCIGIKQNTIAKLEKNIFTAENSLIRLENEYLKINKTLQCYELAFRKMVKKCKLINELSKQITVDNKFTQDIEDVVIIKELETKLQTKFNDHKVKESNNSLHEKENTSAESAKLIEDLVAENTKLRRELHDLNEQIDAMGAYVKDMADLQKSLNDLREERNNLNLVLQSMEAEANATNSNPLQIVMENTEIKGSCEVNKTSNENFATNNIMELNGIVKCEIKALASQTEKINRELKFLQENFKSSQAEYSEKIMILNSQLLTRTEMLLRVKDDLDVSLENADNLKDLLESLKQQLDDQKEVLTVSQKEKKDLENKLKSLKDKHIKKELELKQSHNQQLLSLKDQTKMTIDKLNTDVLNMDNALQQKEAEFQSVLSNAKEEHKQEISKLVDCLNVLPLQNVADAFYSDSDSRLKTYSTRIDAANSKLNTLLLSIKEKDTLITNQISTIETLKNQLKDFNELQLDKEQLIATISEIKQMHLQVQNEVDMKDEAKKEALAWKEKYETLLKDFEIMKEKISVLESNILESKSQFEEQVNRNEELNNALTVTSSNLKETTDKFLKLQENYAELEKHLKNTTDMVEKQKQKAQFKLESTNEFKKMYDSVLSLTTTLSNKSYDNLVGIISSLDKTENKLKSFENKVPLYTASLKNSNKQIISNLMLIHQQIEKGFNFLDISVKVPAEELYSKYSDTTLDNVCNLIKFSIDVLVHNIDLKMKAYFDITKELDLARQNAEDLRANLKSSQELLNSSQEAQSQLQKVQKEIEIQKEMISSMISSEEFSSHKIQCGAHIEDLKSQVEKIQNQKNNLIKKFKEKESVIKKLQNEIDCMVSLKDLENQKIKFEAEIKNLNDKFLVEVENSKQLILNLEKEKNNLQETIIAKENQIQVLRSKQETMVPENELADYKSKVSAEIIELNIKYNNKVKELNSVIVEHETKVEALQKVLEDKEKNIKNLDSQLLNMVPKLEFEECKKKSNEVESLKNNFEKESKHLQEIISSLQNVKEEKEKLTKVLEDKSREMDSMISKELFEEYRRKCEDLNNVILENQKEITKLSRTNGEIKAELQDVKETKMSLETMHDENLKCLKDKYENAEKNYTTQMEEIKQRLKSLEKDKLTLEEENKNLSKVNEELLEKKSKLSNQYDNIHKDYLEAVGKMKDQENVVLKLETELKSLVKENAEKLESFKKKIKLLEQEREQLMQEAQERVSATEAKCREDLKILQAKYDKLCTENKELVKIKNSCADLEKQLNDSYQNLESVKAKFSDEIATLNNQLVEFKSNAFQVENDKQSLSNELSKQLEKLKNENSQLQASLNQEEEKQAKEKTLLLEQINTFQEECSSARNKVTELESEKGSLLDKMNSLVSSINDFESEKDNFKKENASLLEQLESLKSLQIGDEGLLSKLKTLESDLEDSIASNKQFAIDNERLQSEVTHLKESLENEISSLNGRNENLSKQISLLEQLDVSNPNSASVRNYIASIREECDRIVKAKDEETGIKLKILVHDFSKQMDIKDRDCDKLTSEILEKNQDLEERLMKQHKNEVSELRQNLFEKECALDDIRDDYEEKLQAKDKKIKEYEATLKTVSNSESGVSPDSAVLTAESSDWDDTWAVPDETIETNTSPVTSVTNCEEHLQEIEGLKDEVSKCNSEIKELKVLLRLSPPESMLNNDSRRDSLQSIPEPTEFEYLKNIIYEYMMGKEPITLAKVIAAVLRFSESQTQQVIRKEESRHQTSNHWLS